MLIFVSKIMMQWPAALRAMLAVVVRCGDRKLCYAGPGGETQSSRDWCEPTLVAI